MIAKGLYVAATVALFLLAGSAATALGAGVDSTAPTLAWAEIIGGIEGLRPLLAADASGNIFLAGVTRETGFPVVNAAFPRHSGDRDIFLMKISPSGNVLWSTFMGGSGRDEVRGMVVDAHGNVIIAGCTFSARFPVAHAFQSHMHGESDAFVAKFSRSGALLWSSFLGGSQFDYAWGLAVDGTGNVVVAGLTRSGDFPSRLWVTGSYRGMDDCFVARISSSGRLLWTRLMGGSDDDYMETVTFDKLGNIILTGTSASTDFPVRGAFQSANVGPAGSTCDCIVVKMTPAGKVLWSRYLGGSDSDYIGCRAIDPNGNLYLGGYTMSRDFPVTDGLDRRYGGTPAEETGDGFLTKVSPSGRLIWSTLIGSDNDDQVTGVSLDSTGDVIVSGYVCSAAFPADRAYGPLSTISGNVNVFVTKLTHKGLPLWTILLGDDNWTETWRNSCLDRGGNAYIAGDCYGSGLPVSEGLQFGPGGHTYTAKVSPDGHLAWLSTMGGSNLDSVRGTIMSDRRSLLIVGTTASSDFPASVNMQPDYTGGSACYALKLNISGSP